MLLELSEILACPACGPPQVMVAVVERSDGRWVSDGVLACPACDSRFPIDSGWVHLYQAPAADSGDRDVPFTGAASDEAPLLVSALMGLERGTGHLLFGPGLSGVAEAVAHLAERWSVISVVAGEPPQESAPALANLSRLVVDPRVSLPLQPGRLSAAALDAGATERSMAEAARLLRPGGRLVVLAPGEGAEASLKAASLEVVASDQRAVLARRPLHQRP